MYNERENVQTTFSALKNELEKLEVDDFEIIFVNDGSTDDTMKICTELAMRENRLNIIGYERNIGRGNALRTGFDYCSGDIVATIDFDLSYSTFHIKDIFDTFRDFPDADIVLVSAYMNGGSSIGVPPFRLFISKLSNCFLWFLINRHIHTYTCVVRGYRKDALRELGLVSDGKEIHLEVILKALKKGMKIVEIPGQLKSRKMGKSKFKFGKASFYHLLMVAREKPFVMAIGIIAFLSGFLFVFILILMLLRR